jgi:Lrp/AsnC family transcriptional regulator, leucine-responsive regulatory protein
VRENRIPAIDLDEFDKRILAALRADGRLSIVELAERVGLSQTPVRKRVQALEDAGIIDGYAARVNRRALGFGVKAFLEIKLETHRHEHAATLHDALVILPQVQSLFVISGNADLLLEISARDLEDYDRFLIDTVLKLPMVKEVRTLFVMRTFKHDDVVKWSPSADSAPHGKRRSRPS